MSLIQLTESQFDDAQYASDARDPLRSKYGPIVESEISGWSLDYEGLRQRCGRRCEGILRARGMNVDVPKWEKR